MKKKRWRKRTYLYDGKEVDSHDVLGMLHKARKDKAIGDECASCLKRIRKGQEYIAQLTYDPLFWHKNCFLEDHEGISPLYIGVGIRTTFNRLLWRKKTIVICEDFSGKSLDNKGCRVKQDGRNLED